MAGARGLSRAAKLSVFSLRQTISHILISYRKLSAAIVRSVPLSPPPAGSPLFLQMHRGKSQTAAGYLCKEELPFKEALVACSEGDIGIIKSPVGLPGRAIMNDFLRSTTVKKRTFSCPWQCLAGCQAEESNYCISMALNNARRGHLKSGFAFVGSNAPRVKRIESAAHLMGELRREYFTAFFADKKQLLVDTAERFSALKAELSLAENRLRQLKENIQTLNVNQEIIKVSDRLERLRNDMMRCLNGLVDTARA